jgi:hypothetical protein
LIVVEGGRSERCPAFTRSDAASSWPIAAAPAAGTPNGYRLLVKCGCGVEFKRWVAPEDANEDLLRSALLAFEELGER